MVLESNISYIAAREYPPFVVSFFTCYSTFLFVGRKGRLGAGVG